MKIRHFLAITTVLSIYNSCAYAQQSLKSVYNSRNAAWLGLDFSMAKMVGPDGFRDPDRIVNVYLNAWNDMFITERNKYDVDRALRLNFTALWPSFFMESNLALDPRKLVGYDTRTTITDKELQNAVASYDLSRITEQAAVAIVVEELNSLTKNGVGYLIIIDTASKTIVYKHRLTGKPGGISFRNYWAGTYDNWVKTIRRSAWPQIKQEIRR